MDFETFQDFSQSTKYLERWIEEHGIQLGKTKELTNVFYTVEDPDVSNLTPHLPWAEAEFAERVAPQPRNPGNSWTHLPEVWKPMMEGGNHFSYTYGERLHLQLHNIVSELIHNPNSREAFIEVWSGSLDSMRLSKRRVPCTLGYQFLIRDGKLHLTYLQRSCNFRKHYQDDCYLAVSLQEWISGRVMVPRGTFSHWVGSLHVFT